MAWHGRVTPAIYLPIEMATIIPGRRSAVGPAALGILPKTLADTTCGAMVRRQAFSFCFLALTQASR